MHAIKQQAQSIDRNALTFQLFGAGSIQFNNAIKKAAADLNGATPEGLTVNEVQEWIEDDVNSARCELLNNNTNTRWNTPEPTTILAPVDWNIVPFAYDCFTGGGIHVKRIGLFNWKATANKCGCYSVYTELEYTVLTGVLTDPKLAVFVTRADGSYSQWFGNILDRKYGNQTGTFLLNGSDLVWLDCGDSVDIRLYVGNALTILPNSYDWDGYVAISYQGNQY